MHARVNRVIRKPAGLRKLPGNLLAQPAARRRVSLLAEQAKALALVRRKLLRQFAERIQRRLTARGLQNPRAVTLRVARRAVRIIKIQNRSLRVAVRRAVTLREKRVALDFD